MHITFSLLEQNLIDAFWEVFKNESNLNISPMDILTLSGDAILSPANSFGFMNGGIDYVYREHFGYGLEKNLKEAIRQAPYYGELGVGHAISLDTEHTCFPRMIFAPTMRVPQPIVGTLNAYFAFKAALVLAKELKLNSIVTPAFGTGAGRLQPIMAAKQMKAAYDAVVKEEAPLYMSFTEATLAQEKLIWCDNE